MVLPHFLHLQLVQNAWLQPRGGFEGKLGAKRCEESQCIVESGSNKVAGLYFGTVEGELNGVTGLRHAVSILSSNLAAEMCYLVCIVL